MKHTYTYTLSALLAITLSFGAATAVAQSKISPAGRLFLAEHQSEILKNATAKISGKEVVTDTPRKATSATTDKAISRIPKVAALVKMKNGVDPQTLADAGYDVSSRLISYAVVNVDIDKVEQLATLPGVARISFGEKSRHFLDNGRQASGVQDALDGFEFNGETHTFTGRGVLTGIYDTGVAPNHVNFLNADGSTRLKKLIHYAQDPDDEESITISDYYVSGIPQFTTDDETETHGTHTLGIMAGGYRNDVSRIDVEYTDGNWMGDIVTEANPYHGVATQSDILVGCGELWTAATIDAMTKMGEYAKENNQPLVINYSAGSLSGPHDGSDDVSQAFSEIQKQYNAIICVAAGNDGGGKVSFEKEFTSSNDAIKTCVTALEGYNGANCIIDIWGDDETPFNVDFTCYKPRINFSGAATTKLFTVNKADQTFNYASVSGSGITKNTALSNAFSQAQVIALSEIDENSGRYHVMALVFYVKKSQLISGYYDSYISIAVSGEEGHTVMGTASNLGEFTAQSTTSGSVGGNDKNSISSSACSESVISVGAYQTRRFYGTLGYSVSYVDEANYTDGGVVSFSSYGPTLDGRQLPEVIAPGLNIISSYNPYYLKANAADESSTGKKADDMSAVATINDATYHWGAMSGTSMATPMVAGTIALWLEADPTLNIFQVREIIGKTSTKDDAVKSAPLKSGSGKISAVEGLKEILSRINVSGIGGIADDESNLILEQSASSIEIFVAGESGIAVNIYSTQGALVGHAGESGDRLQISTDTLSKGIYVLEILPAGGGRVVKKIAIK